ncbi:MAG: Uncharacterized protein G01um10145_756 [Microgenomates group bacterium Gr01-1014_5]|nr:MAG: Uncharacterized protein G01um10145_756 [Microgenomates group bacterium Gr01-1014_5]
MLKTYLYIPEELDRKIKIAVNAQQKSKAEIIRNAIAKGLSVSQEQDKNDAQILLDLAKIAKKYKVSGPRDLSVNHDYYLWGGKKRNSRIKP